MPKINRIQERLPQGIALVFILALILRLWGLAHGLPFTVHPDEQSMVRRALRMGSGDLNPYFFYYPSFSIYLYFLVDGLYFAMGRLLGFFHSSQDLAVHFVRDLTGIYLSARLLIATVDALTTVVIYKISRKLMDERHALLAGFLWAFSSLAIHVSKVAKPDSLMAFLAVLAFYLLISAKNNPSLFVSALVLGLSVSSKYSSLMLSPAFGLWVLFQNARPEEKIKRLVLVGAGVVAGFLLGTPFAILDHTKFLHDFREQMAIMKTGFTGAEGGGYAWKTYLALFTKSVWNYLTAVAAFCGFIGLFRSDKKMAFTFAAVLFIPLASFFAQRIGAPHYLIILLPFYLVVVSYGIFWLRQRKLGKRWAAPLAFLLVFHSTTLAYKTVKEYARPDPHTEVGEWILQNIPDGKSILIDPMGPFLPMDRKQLERLYERAKAEHHIKADYFGLLLKAGPAKGYVVYYPEWPVNVMPPDLIKAARSVQDVLPIEAGLEPLRRAGVDYVVVNGGEREMSVRYGQSYPGLPKYFEALDHGPALVKEFRYSSGEAFWVYQLK